jgi:hypothetical protein
MGSACLREQKTLAEWCHYFAELTVATWTGKDNLFYSMRRSNKFMK